MMVSVEKLPQSRVKLRVELDADEVHPYLEAVARDLSKDHPLKGFRPGAVPLAMMRSVVGDEALAEKALQDLVPKTYVQALVDHEEIEAIGQPEVTAKNVTVGERWVYEATVAVLPQVTLGNYRNIRGERREPTVETAAVAQELLTLQKMRASYLTVPRPAQKGDRVEVDISISVDHVPLEGGAVKRQPVLIGESRLVPGFEEHIIGMREGETRTFTMTFPAQHHERNLGGRTGEFTVVMGTVQQRVLPALDDAFAKGLGKFTGIDDLRAKLAENLRAEYIEKERQRLQMALLTQVVQSATFGEFPSILVEGEIEKMVEELTEGLKNMELTFDQYLQQIRKTAADVKEGFRPQALERIRAGLTLRELAKTENILVSDEEVEEEVKRVLRMFPSVEEAQRHVDPEELAAETAGTIRNRKVFALLEQFAGIG